jgi:hypothetical protein
MRMPTRPKLAIPTVVALAVVAAAALALSARTSPPRFHELSNQGRQVDSQTIPARQRTWLLQDGYSTDLRLLAQRDGIRFYLGSGLQSGARCYFTAVAAGAGERFDGLGCPAGFPSDEQPILDTSWYRQSLGDRYPTVDHLAGFAADGVAAVGVRDPAGNTSWTPVVGNVFSASPTGRVAALVARTAGGEVVYSARLGGGTAPLEGYSR